MHPASGGGTIRYSVVGRWHGGIAEVSWDGHRFEGPGDLVADVKGHAGGGADHLAGALGAIGRAMDEVLSLRVDDGGTPWDVDTRPIRPASAWRRRQILRAASPKGSARPA